MMYKTHPSTASADTQPHHYMFTVLHHTVCLAPSRAAHRDVLTEGTESLRHVWVIPCCSLCSVAECASNNIGNTQGICSSQVIMDGSKKQVLMGTRRRSRTMQKLVQLHCIVSLSHQVNQHSFNEN